MLDNFEDVLNGFLKMRNVDVYVTGSNAKFLSKDIITEFRGRGFEAVSYTHLILTGGYGLENGASVEVIKQEAL